MNEYPRTRFEEKWEGGILMHLLLRRLNIKRQTQHFIRANLASAQWTLCPTMKQCNRCGTATPVTPIFFPFLHPQPFQATPL